MNPMRKTLFITRLVVLLAITMAIELIGLPQPVTGPFINFMLILTTLLISTTGGLIIGVITPVLAVLRGQLPAPLAIMAPFIILANLLYVGSFALLKIKMTTSEWHYYLRNGLALILAALIKFLILLTTARYALPFLFGKTLPDRLLSLMALPQFITALFGGLFALFIFHIWQKRQTR